MIDGPMKDRNELLRSAHEIARRKGVDTNWEAFENNLRRELLKWSGKPEDADKQTVLRATCTAKTYRLPAGGGVVAEISRLQAENSLLTGHVDLMVDEFKRIKSLCHDTYPHNTEISGLCDRAIPNTFQHFPVIVQRDDAIKAKECLAYQLRTAEQENERLRWKLENTEAKFRAAESLAADRLADQEAIERRVAREWQPIETAPKDGTDLLLWCGWAITGLWFNGRWCTEDKGNVIFMVTHWMSLPEPPQEIKARYGLEG